jgi:hypothetical protein
MKAYPQVKVHIEYSRTDKVCEACLNNAIDFGIVAFPLRRANVAVIPWHDEKLVLVCAAGHRLARRRKVSLAQLRGEDFIAFERDIPTRKTIDRILRTHRVAVNTVMEFDNIETLKRSVEVGGGVSILPETTVVNEVKSGLLATADFTEGRFTRTVGIIHRRGRVPSAAAREFVRLLLATPARPREIESPAVLVRTPQGGAYALLDWRAADRRVHGRMSPGRERRAGARGVDDPGSRMERQHEGSGQVHVLLRSRCVGVSARHAGRPRAPHLFARS